MLAPTHSLSAQASRLATRPASSDEISGWLQTAIGQYRDRHRDPDWAEAEAAEALYWQLVEIGYRIAHPAWVPPPTVQEVDHGPGSPADPAVPVLSHQRGARSPGLGSRSLSG